MPCLTTSQTLGTRLDFLKALLPVLNRQATSHHRKSSLPVTTLLTLASTGLAHHHVSCALKLNRLSSGVREVLEVAFLHRVQSDGSLLVRHDKIFSMGCYACGLSWQISPGIPALTILIITISIISPCIPCSSVIMTIGPMFERYIGRFRTFTHTRIRCCRRLQCLVSVPSGSLGLPFAIISFCSRTMRCRIKQPVATQVN